MRCDAMRLNYDLQLPSSNSKNRYNLELIFYSCRTALALWWLAWWLLMLLLLLLQSTTFSSQLIMNFGKSNNNKSAENEF